MRIVATSDTHAPVDPRSIPEGDVFIHAGDIMTTGYLDEWRWACEWLAALPHKTKIFVPGNHDFHFQVYPGPALQDMRRAGVTVVGLPGNINYHSVVLPNDMVLVGLPFVTNLERWAFNKTEEDIAAYLDTIPCNKADIIVSHAPLYGTLDLSHRDNEHAGVNVYHAYMQKMNPSLWFHGHIHEGYGHAMLSNCNVYNVAMSDRKGRHANAPVVLDV